MIRRTRLVYGVLISLWALILAWQIMEHHRVRHYSRETLINRAKDICNTCGVVIRSQRRFGGFISRERLESALKPLIRPGEVLSLALLNTAGDVVASAGAPIDFERQGLVPTGAHWAETTVALMNLVDLGTNETSEAEGQGPAIVMPRAPVFPTPATNRPPDNPPAPRDREGSRSRPDGAWQESPPPPAAIRPDDGPGGTNASPRDRRWGRSRPDGNRPPFGRPFWMSEQDYQSLIRKQGVHSFVIVLSTASMRAANSRDLWLRAVLCAFATLAVAGGASAWRHLSKSSELEVRLVRAAELNTRLKEMNLAAAGLAHETKNPLNIVRGLAQMISKQEDASPEIRSKSTEIVDQTDQVTAQLNEFIHYFRPREVRRSAVPLASVVAEVTRALSYDVEEKAIRLEVPPQLPVIEADEQLLRQALFNLLLNAIQAVDRDGHIQIAASNGAGNEIALELRDNGPGVPPEHRADIFKPYFTTNEKGTGLGLAVVQQIVLAHGWEIICLPNQPRGAIFRISHLRLANTAAATRAS